MSRLDIVIAGAMSVRHWILVLGVLLLSSSASADSILFTTDFSDYDADFLATGGTVVLSQNLDSVELEGTANYNASITRPLLPLPQGLGGLSLVIGDLIEPSQVSVQILYYNASGFYLGVLDAETPIPFAVVGENVGGFGLTPPAEAAQLRARILLGNGSQATLDGFTIFSVPEPKTATLLSLGLALIGWTHRKRS